MIIYKVTNLITNKIYVGKDSKNRYCYYGSGILLKTAIEKYGKENFKKEILEECEDATGLNEQEKVWINTLNSTNRSVGYNISTGGDGGDTFTNNPNKEKTREKLVATANSVEVKSKNIERNTGKNNPFYGKTHTDETKVKISNANLGNKYSVGRKVSTETKVKMSASKKGITYDEKYGIEKSNELKKKLKDTRTGKKLGPYPSICGELNPSKRIEVKTKLSKKKLENDRYKLLCVYCKKDFTKQNYIKSHGDKCKCKKN